MSQRCSCRMEHGPAVRQPWESCWGKVQNPPEGLDHTEQEGMSEGAATDCGTGTAAACARTRKGARGAQLQHAVIQP